MTDNAPAHARGRRRGFRLRLWQIAIGGAIAAVLIGIGLWQVLADSGSPPSSGSPIPKGVKPVPITTEGLRTIASLGVVIYWAGEKPGFTYELSKTDKDRTYIRYLPAGVDVGSDRPYLTIGTYPMANAFAKTSKLAGKAGAVPVAAGKDRVAFYNEKSPRNVFVAARGLAFQVEVYAPSPSEAQRVAGKVSAVR